MARLQRSLDLEAACRRDQQWVDEALASGPEERFRWDKYEAAVKRGLERAKGKA